MNPADLQDLPGEVRAEIERESEDRSERLRVLGIAIAKMRDEAVTARRESGIEDTMAEAEEAYLGIDDENRAEFAGARWAKPHTMDGPLTSRRANSSDQVRATAFLNETRRYVNAGAAKVCEIALPVDGKPFTLKATPVPEMAGAAEDDTPAEQVTGQPMPGPDGQPVSVKVLAKHQIDKAEQAAEKAATRIYDWMVEYKHNAEVRKVIFDGARIGVGVLKGPVAESRKVRVVRRVSAPPADVGMPTEVASASSLTIEIIEKVKPAARWVDPWCFYPAPGCGEDIHKGGHAFETDKMLAEELRALGEQQQGFFDPDAIARVIKEGPGKTNNDQGNPNKKPHEKQFDVWHFYGKVKKDDFRAANPKQAGDFLNDDGEAAEMVSVVVTLVNDTVIRAILDPLDSGRLPFHVFNWSRRAGHWVGVGVAEQVRTPQRVLNSAARRMFSNAGQSSGSQIVMDPDAVEPAVKGDWKITPDKLWWLRKDSGVDDVRKVFASFEWPNTTAQLMVIVEFALKMFEEHSSIPLITQGQSGKDTPDTFGGQKLQDSNAQQLLRDVGFGLNDTVTTPFVDQCYEWLLLDAEIPEDEKGDYQVDTSGAMALIEKALQDVFVAQLLAASLNPAYELSPALCMQEFIRSKRMNPEAFRLTEAEIEQRKQAPPPVAPAVEAAKIRAASAEKIAQESTALAAQRNQNDIDRDTAYQNSLNERGAATDALALETLRLKVRLAELELAAQERISLQEAKVKLADTTLKLTVQKELAGMDGEGPQIATPEVEPEGRAEPGRAFQD